MNATTKREAVYKCTNKDYLPEAKPRTIILVKGLKTFGKVPRVL